MSCSCGNTCGAEPLLNPDMRTQDASAFLCHFLRQQHQAVRPAYQCAQNHGSWYTGDLSSILTTRMSIASLHKASWRSVIHGEQGCQHNTLTGSSLRGSCSRSWAMRHKKRIKAMAALLSDDTVCSKAMLCVQTTQ